MISSQMLRCARKEWAKLASEDSDELAVKGLAGSVGAGMVGAAGSLGVRHMGARSSRFADDAALAKKIRSTVDVPVENLPGHNAYWAGKGWQTDHPIEHIGIGEGVKDSPAILAHELGHQEISRNPVGRIGQNRGTLALGAGAVPIGLLSGALSGLSDDERVQRAGRWAPLITSAPQLAYEAGASALGLRRMHRAGASGRQMIRAAGTLLPAWGTYAANAGAGVAAAHGIQGAVRGARERSEEG